MLVPAPLAHSSALINCNEGGVAQQQVPSKKQQCTLSHPLDLPHLDILIGVTRSIGAHFCAESVSDSTRPFAHSAGNSKRGGCDS